MTEGSTMKRRAETVIVPVVLLFACVVMAADGPRLPQDDPNGGPGALPPGEQVSLWDEVNNGLLPAERRANAERELIRAHDARMLEMVFRGLTGPVEIIHLPDPAPGPECRGRPDVLAIHAASRSSWPKDPPGYSAPAWHPATLPGVSESSPTNHPETM